MRSTIAFVLILSILFISAYTQAPSKKAESNSKSTKAASQAKKAPIKAKANVKISAGSKASAKTTGKVGAKKPKITAKVTGKAKATGKVVSKKPKTSAKVTGKVSIKIKNKLSSSEIKKQKMARNHKFSIKGYKMTNKEKDEKKKESELSAKLMKGSCPQKKNVFNLDGYTKPTKLEGKVCGLEIGCCKTKSVEEKIDQWNDEAKKQMLWTWSAAQIPGWLNYIATKLNYESLAKMCLGPVPNGPRKSLLKNEADLKNKKEILKKSKAAMVKAVNTQKAKLNLKIKKKNKKEAKKIKGTPKAQKKTPSKEKSTKKSASTAKKIKKVVPVKKVVAKKAQPKKTDRILLRYTASTQKNGVKTKGSKKNNSSKTKKTSKAKVQMVGHIFNTKARVSTKMPKIALGNKSSKPKHSDKEWDSIFKSRCKNNLTKFFRLEKTCSEYTHSYAKNFVACRKTLYKLRSNLMCSSCDPRKGKFFKGNQVMLSKKSFKNLDGIKRCVKAHYFERKCMKPQVIRFNHFLLKNNQITKEWSDKNMEDIKYLWNHETTMKGCVHKTVSAKFLKVISADLNTKKPLRHLQQVKKTPAKITKKVPAKVTGKTSAKAPKAKLTGKLSVKKPKAAVKMTGKVSVKAKTTPKKINTTAKAGGKLKVKVNVTKKSHFIRQDKIGKGLYRQQEEKVSSVTQKRLPGVAKFDKACRTSIKKWIWNKLSDFNQDFIKYVSLYELLNKSVVSWTSANEVQKYWNTYYKGYLWDRKQYAFKDDKRTEKGEATNKDSKPAEKKTAQKTPTKKATKATTLASKKASKRRQLQTTNPKIDSSSAQKTSSTSGLDETTNKGKGMNIQSYDDPKIVDFHPTRMKGQETPFKALNSSLIKFCFASLFLIFNLA